MSFLALELLIDCPLHLGLDVMIPSVDTEHVFTIPPAGIPPEKDCFPAPPAQKPITGSNVHVRRIRTGAYSILRQVDKILEKMVGA